MTRQMLLIPADGSTLRPIQVGDLIDITQQIGAHYAEDVALGDGWSLIVDKEGRTHQDKAVNLRATLAYSGWSTIVGDALLTLNGRDDEGGIDWVTTPVDEARLFLAGRGVHS